MNTKICTKCNQELPLSAFYSRGGGKLRSECKNCHKKFVSKRYAEKKDTVADYKSQYKCAKCGENRSYCLDFHHIDPSQKDGTIARILANRSSLDKVFDEIKKCIILCSNCHREFHYQEKKNKISIEEYLK